MLGSLSLRPKVEFTYSTPHDSLVKRTFIRAIESIGGQRRLKALYEQFLFGYTETGDFFQSAIELLQLKICADERPLNGVPSEGPVVFVANHPYGVLDGIVLTWLARKVRPDVKVMANHVLCKAPDAADALLPVDFTGNEKALKTNIQTRKTAIEILKNGGAIGIFPAGGVGASERPHKGPALDAAWHPFTARMIRQTGATVVPIYFGGQNSRLFQLASHTSATIRLGLFFHETTRRIGSELEFVVGAPISATELNRFEDRDELVKFLRKRTFNLAACLEKPKSGYPRHDKEFSFPKHVKF